MGLTAMDSHWGVVLAGGDGHRLQPFVERVVGDDRPKQFAPIMGSRSLLGQTLDRLTQLVPPRRTVISAVRRHAGFLAEEALNPRIKVLLQPSDRGTAAGLLYPVYWIHRIDPGAVIAAFPSDHYVLEERLFMSHVARVATFVASNPNWMVLVGARPSDADTGYGWIERAETLSNRGFETVWRVSRFLEKPTVEQAHACFARGHLWNTFVVVARAETFVNAARLCLPDLHVALSDAVTFRGAPQETEVLDAAYESLPHSSFADTVLSDRFPRLAVSCLPPVIWSDLGTPERLVRIATILAQRRHAEEPAPPMVPAAAASAARSGV